MKHTHRASFLASCSFVVALASMPAAAAAETDVPPQTPQGSWSHGMMGGYGMGPGMMGGYGMGPGMMGGYGMGPGMMGGYGMGPGMMGGYLAGLDLSDEQQAKINRIQDDTRKKHWALMGQIQDEQARLRDLYAAPKRDDAAIDATHKSVLNLQQQMYETRVDAQKRMEAVLTKEQQDRLRSQWRRGWGPGS